MTKKIIIIMTGNKKCYLETYYYAISDYKIKIKIKNSTGIIKINFQGFFLYGKVEEERPYFSHSTALVHLNE